MAGIENDCSRKTLLEALHDKYSITEESDIKILVRLPKGAPGFTEEGKLIVPPILALNKCKITHAGDNAELKDLCSDICELDLAENNIQEWEEIFSILSHCPGVTFLNLSKNLLRNSTTNVEDAMKNLDVSLQKLEKLVLNSLQLDWAIVWQLLTILPRVQEVHLSLNEYQNVTVDTSETFPSVEKIFINGNKFCDWSEVSKLGRIFPRLQTLVMTENPITCIDTSQPPEETFPNMTSLNISQTELRDWAEIEKLRSFSALTDVRLSCIPFMENLEPKLRRQMALAYLPAAERLNGSPVYLAEREDAERAFIRLYLDSATEEKPKRCLELESVYGKLDHLAEVDLSSKSDEVQVLVVFNEKSKLMEINITHTVGEVKKQQLGSFCGLSPAQFRLYHRDHTGWMGDEELKYPKKVIHTTGLKTGDELHIVPR